MTDTVYCQKLMSQTIKGPKNSTNVYKKDINMFLLYSVLVDNVLRETYAIHYTVCVKQPSWTT